VSPARRREGATAREPPRPVTDRERPGDVDVRPPARRLHDVSVVVASDKIISSSSIIITVSLGITGEHL